MTEWSTRSVISWPFPYSLFPFFFFLLVLLGTSELHWDLTPIAVANIGAKKRNKEWDKKVEVLGPLAFPKRIVFSKFCPYKAFFIYYDYFYFYLFILNYFIVIQLHLSAFSLHPSTPPQPNLPPSPASTLPLGFVHGSFIVVPENASPHYPFPPPLWLLLDCS